MKKLLLGALLALLPLTGFSATILGFQAGGGVWTHDPSGFISTTSDGVGVSADLKNDLKLSEEDEGYSYFILEHPVPLIPNIKIMNTKLTATGASGSANFTYNSVDYTTSVNSNIELDQTDFILYYEVLDNIVSFDVGLTAKKIDGKVTVDTDTKTFSGTIPMLYVAAEIVLPAGFSIAADISSISAGNDSVTDSSIKLVYTSDFNLGIEAGVRTQSIKFDDNTVKVDIEFDGVFVGAFFKF